MPALLIEACVDSLETARAAQEAGAGRLELCGAGDGGLTPSAALLAEVLAMATVPVHVMVRPREGDFLYTASEFEEMRESVMAIRATGAQGVVFGILHEDSTLDAERMAELIALARPMRVACHRAFDRTPSPDEALDALLELGVDLVLTSGHARTALEGAAVLSRHVSRAGERIVILAGGSVRAENIGELVVATDVREAHARATDPAVFAKVVLAARDARA